MKKVGIVTMNGCENIGNILQKYAVEQLLLAQGCTPFLLNNTTKMGFPAGSAPWLQRSLWKKLRPSYIAQYRRSKLHAAYGCKNDRDCSGLGLRRAKQGASARREAQAARRERFLCCVRETLTIDEVPLDALRHDRLQLGAYDAFVCGSDQIWNPNYNTTSSVDFLQFAPQHKRIALAPSFGVAALPAERRDDYRRWISAIPHLSVREDAGARLIAELTDREAQVLLDPTFGLRADQWRAYAKEPALHPAGDYVFCYFLGNETNRHVRHIRAHAKTYGCEIVDVYDIHDLRYYATEPREFVWLLAHAKAVFTDSFHGTAFAINLQVPFEVFDRVEGGASMSSRIASVLKKTGLTDRLYPRTELRSFYDLSFRASASVIEQERGRINAYLSDALATAMQGTGPALAGRYQCTGCGACCNACQAGALTMRADSEGFAYPQIDTALCIGCNACEAACPANSPSPEDADTGAYFAYAKDPAICRAGSSGGLFPLLAQAIVGKGGVVYGVGYDEAFNVCHKRIASADALPALYTSKYVQSDVGLTMREAQEDLRAGKTVLFTGTPCQIAALHSFFGREYENLYTQDIICHGVPSPGVFRQYLDQQHGGHSITAISFRDKTVGWNNFSMKVTYDDGTHYRQLATKDPFVRAFLANLTLRPSCYQCQYKTVARCSDITLADYWGVETVHPALHEQQGVSLVLTHTKKGEALLDAVRDSAEIGDTALPRAIAMNHAATHCVRWHPKRYVFFSSLQTQPMAQLVDQCLRQPASQKARRVILRCGARVKKLLRAAAGK